MKRASPPFHKGYKAKAEGNAARARPRPRRRKMAKRISQSLLWLIAAAALAERVVIEDFAGPVDAFFLDDGSAAGLPSSAVWKSTSASGAPDDSTPSHFSAMTRPS